MPSKRKRSSAAPSSLPSVPQKPSMTTPILPTKRLSSRGAKVNTNVDQNTDIVDSKVALRASPDADGPDEALDIGMLAEQPPTIRPKGNGRARSSRSVAGNDDEIPKKEQRKTQKKSSVAAKKGSDEIKAFKAAQASKKLADTDLKRENDDGASVEHLDPDDDDQPGAAEDADVVKLEARRVPPVNSDYLPLPWKGRLGYACLNTYLRLSSPPIFTSRTCRIASILEHRHPLRDPSQPEHPTKNRPDRSQPASIERGQRYVEEICLANIRDIPKMLRWNEKYGIKFMRLSSEMFPFAGHAEYGYKLAPFASEFLAEAGKVAAELGHRLSTHPGQFTQLGSPRPEVTASAYRDLGYHDEMLTLLGLPEQQDRDAVLILHMGGTFGDKGATLDRFRENYKQLPPSVKQRIVLENDDVSWSVHDLLPICEELNIPLCLDFHHHNIIFDSSQLREGTLDIMALYPRIKATWDRKRIRQKMHYSEQCPEAITGRQRRKHNPRPAMLPPCPNDMDLMIEAKDKEQAVFDLMRTFKLPGWEKANYVVPYERDDDNRPLPAKPKQKKTKKQITEEVEEFGRELSAEEDVIKDVIPEAEVGMGGQQNRVYWPTGMEEWLRPKKRVVKGKSGPGDDEEDVFRNPTPANFAARKAITARNNAALSDTMRTKLKEVQSAADLTKLLEEIKTEAKANESSAKEDTKPAKRAKATPKKAGPKKTSKSASTPSIAKLDDEDNEDLSMPELSEESNEKDSKVDKASTASTKRQRQSGRASGKRMSYAEVDDNEDLE